MTATLSNWRQHPFSAWGFCNVDKLIPVEPIAGAKAPPLLAGAGFDLAAISIDENDRRLTVAAALAATQTDGFLVLHDGKVVAEAYGGVQDRAARHIVFSVSKSITGVLAGCLAADGLLDPDAPVTHYVPEVKGSAYDGATLRNLLDMTVNIRFVEDYVDPKGDVARYRVAMGWNPAGAVTGGDDLHGFIAKLPAGDGRHGARFHYVSPNSDMLGWVIERAAGQRLHRLLSERLWRPMGASDDAFITVDRNGSPRSAGGICTTLRDLARFGELMRNGGAANSRQVVPAAWVQDIFEGGDHGAWSRGEMAPFFPAGRYRSQWYSPGDRTGALYAIGIHGQWIHVDRQTGLVIVKQSSQPIPADLATDYLTDAAFRAIIRQFRR